MRSWPDRRQFLALTGGIFLPVASVRSAHADSDGPLSGAALYRDVEAYTAFGDHRSGGPADQATADWLSGRMTGLGYDCRFQSLDLPGFEIKACGFAAGGEFIPGFPVWPPVTLTSGQTALPVVIDPPAGMSFDGKVALITQALPWRAEMPAEDFARLQGLASQGAAAIAFCAGSPGLGLYAYNAPLPLKPLSCPAICVSQAGMLQLRALASEGKAIGAICDAVAAEGRARNVIAMRKGDPGGKQLVVSTPMSGWFRCGAERGPGVALWLGLAAWAAAQEGLSVTFAATSGHELGNAGMKEFLTAGAPAPEHTKLFVSLGANIAPRAQARPGMLSKQYLLFDLKAAWPVLRALGGGGRTLMPTFVSRFGEVGEVAHAGYHPHFGFAGQNPDFHSPGDLAENTGPDELAAAAAGIRDAIKSLLSQV